MAGMRWTLVEMPLGGADQYTDAPHVVPGKMHDLQNVSFRQPPKLGKRYGTNAANVLKFGGGTIDSCTNMIAHDKETILVDAKGDLHTYSDLHDYWRKVGRTSDALVDVEQFRNSTSTAQIHGDATYNQTVLAVFSYSTADTSLLRVDLVDTRTGATYYTETVSTAGLGVLRAIPVGNYAYCIWYNSSGAAIWYTRIDVTSTSPSASTPAAVTTTNTPKAAVRIDAAPLLGGTDFLVSYADNATDELNVDRVTQSNTVANNHVGSSVVSQTAVYGTSGGDVWAAYDSGSPSKVYFDILTDTLGTVATATQASTGNSTPIKIGITALNTTLACIVWEETEVSPKRAYLRYRIVNDSGGVSGSGSTDLDDVIPHSKPWTHDGRAYCIAAYDDKRYMPSHVSGAGIYSDQSSQPTYFVLELTGDSQAAQTPRWCGSFLRGLANPYVATRGVATAVSGSEYWCVTQTRTRIRFGAGDDSPILLGSRFGLDIAKVNLASVRRFRAAPWGSSLVLAGARPSIYDGAAINEVGMAWRPENWEAPVLSTTGGYIPAHTVNVNYTNIVLVYEWEDADGNVHRSAPSDVIRFTHGSATGTNYYTITMRETVMTSRGTTVRVVPYRTVKDGTVYYRDSTGGFAATYGTAVTVGVEFSDTDTSVPFITAQEVLYTTGDILDDAGLPPCKTIVYHGDRLWLGGTDDPEWIWFSQPFVEAEGPRFNEALRVLIGEPVTAMASMDDQLIVFSRTKIYVVSGQGPPATGGLDIGFQVSLVTTDTGTDEPRSVVLTPAGIFFKGGKGIYILTRALQLEWIGAEAKGYFDTYPIVACATLSPDTTEVQFGAQNTANTASRRIVYNYATQSWHIHSPPASDDLIRASCAAYVGSVDGYRYRFATSRGAVYTETATKWTDGSAKVTWQAITPWLKLNTLQGWQRIRTTLLLIQRLAGYDDFGLRVQFAYNYNSSSFTDTHSFSVAEITALAEDQVEIAMKRQQCESVRMKITETFNEAGEAYNSPGPNLRSIVFEAGVKGQGMLLDASKARK